MNCPRDGTPLIASKLRGVEVDVCDYCNGVWFDEHELSQLHGAATDLAKATPIECQNPLACPACSTRMERFRFVEEGELDVDRCGGCHGVWLDTDELKAVLKAVGGSTPPGVHRTAGATSTATAARPKAAPAAQPQRSLPIATGSLSGTESPLGLVSGDAVVGAELIRNSLARVRGVAGGHQAGFAEALLQGRKIALEEMTHAAAGLGADAIVGVQVHQAALSDGALLISMTGTAVKTGNPT
ncbi:MAG: zf-TFIIB domain-containing protein [Armatimonadetes bacterium]|nr:zf-TFIIB domain-containing protein [Armatimonadota bacterium]